MPVDDALDGRQPNSGALKLFRPMQTLKYAKQLVDVRHLKACAVIGDEYLGLIVLPGGTPNLDFGPRPCPGEFDRVGQQVREHQFQHGTVPITDRQRSDRPGDVPILGVLVCFAMMYSLSMETWIRLVVWLVIGLAIYFGYGIKHSHLRAPRR